MTDRHSTRALRTSPSSTTTSATAVSVASTTGPIPNVFCRRSTTGTSARCIPRSQTWSASGLFYETFDRGETLFEQELIASNLDSDLESASARQTVSLGRLFGLRPPLSGAG